MENNRSLVTSRTTIIKESFKSETLKKNFQLLKNFFLNVHEKINQNSNSDEQIKINNKKV